MKKENSAKWEENKKKGDIGEDIVKFLIESVGWKCIKFGIENRSEDAIKMLRDNTSSLANKIRSMPDFLAINNQTGEVLLIDAKYMSWIDRRDPTKTIFDFKIGQIQRYIKFWEEAKLIIINNYEPYFLVINIEDIVESKHYVGECTENLETALRNKFSDYWNFKSIINDIKSLFPNLDDKKIKMAIDMIPKK